MRGTIAWVDLETTGLLPDREKVLEVACVVTDDQLREVARFERVVCYGAAVDIMRTFSDAVVQKMHDDSKLWLECADGSGAEHRSIGAIDHALGTFIRERCPPPDGEEYRGPQLGGSMVNFDRAFMALHLPFAHAQLHYRNLDVTGLNELARRFWPGVHATRPPAPASGHRAMPDILGSIQVARYYAGALRGPEVR